MSNRESMTGPTDVRDHIDLTHFRPNWRRVREKPRALRTPLERDMNLAALRFLTADLPYVRVPCPYSRTCGCGTQSGPHTCEWPSGW